MDLQRMDSGARVPFRRWSPLLALSLLVASLASAAAIWPLAHWATLPWQANPPTPRVAPMEAAHDLTVGEISATNANRLTLILSLALPASRPPGAWPRQRGRWPAVGVVQGATAR